MLIILVYAAIGYLFFKYLWPLLKNPDPKTRPKELYEFYDKHPKLLVLTIIFALLGINEFFSIIAGLFGFVFNPCYPQDGMTDIPCLIKDTLFLTK